MFDDREQVITTDIPEVRSLTDAEAELIRWLLQHGVPQATDYLPQLDVARVVSRCSCGCATISLAVHGVVSSQHAGIGVLAEYEWRVVSGEMFALWLLERSGLLYELEVWSQDGLGVATALPDIDQLQPPGTDMASRWPDPETEQALKRTLAASCANLIVSLGSAADERSP